MDKKITMNLKETISKWPENPRKAVQRLQKTYGEPSEWSASYVIWHNCDPWKRTVVTKTETPHNFPKPHTDFVEQFIDYHVPIDAIDNVIRFDGSIVIDRTRGEISARCGGTSMNFVAINLAHELIMGIKTLSEARGAYLKLYKEYQQGKKPKYTQEFIFDLDGGKTNDPGVEIKEKDLKIRIRKGGEGYYGNNEMEPDLYS